MTSARSTIFLMVGLARPYKASLFAYLAKFFKPVRDLAKMTNMIAQTNVALERTDSILEIEISVQERAAAPRARAVRRRDQYRIRRVVVLIHCGGTARWHVFGQAGSVRARTVIMIAHRSNTQRHADAILVLDKGAIAERGTHEDLLAFKGIYAAVYATQTGAELVWHAH